MEGSVGKGIFEMSNVSEGKCRLKMNWLSFKEGQSFSFHMAPTYGDPRRTCVVKQELKNFVMWEEDFIKLFEEINDDK